MDQVVDRPETETCAKWTLRGIVRTGALLAAATFASLLTVDPPLPAAGRATDAQGERQSAAQPGASQPYVPASDKWIELGVPQRLATPPGLGSQSERLQRSAAADPVVYPGRNPERRQIRYKPGGVHQGAQVASPGRHVTRAAVPSRAGRRPRPA